MAIDKLKDTKMEILLYLGVNRSGYYYGIYKYLALKKGARLYLSNVYRALKKLESEYLIESYKHEKQIEKGQKKGPYYRLSIIGLVKIFTCDDLHKYLGSIAENHANKALVFSEWNYFEKQGATEKVIEAIKDFYNYCISKDSHRYESSIESERWCSSVERELDRYVLFYHLPLVCLTPLLRMDRTSNLMLAERFRVSSFPWVRIWYNKPKLRQYMIKEIAHEGIMARDTLLHIREAKECIKFLSNPSHKSLTS